MARSGISNSLKKLSVLGASDALNTYEICKLGIVNRLTLLCIGFDLALILLNIIIANYQGIIIDLAVLTLIFIPVLLLNYKKRYTQAAYLFLGGVHLAVVTGAVHAASQGRANEIEILLIPAAIAVIILVDHFGQRLLFIINLIAMGALKYFQTDQSSSDYFKLLAILIIGYGGIYYFIMQFKTQLIQALEKTERLNENLVQKEKALMESNQSKVKLFSIVAHDLRSPLGLIQSLLDPSMIDSLEKNKFMEYQNTIRSRFRVLQENMNNLLSWAQSQMGNFKRVPITLNLSQEIAKKIDLFAEMANSKGIEITQSGSKHLNAVLDHNQFKVIMRNVLHNAIKFSPLGGKVMIEIDCKDSYARILISDSGIGIDDDTIRSILNAEPMESSIGTEGERGSGVGLSFCKELIDKNQGTLNIYNAPDSGAIFEICFPLEKA